MPIAKYFKGHGSSVLADMQDRYGTKKGESVFYATAAKRNQTPEDDQDKTRPSIKALKARRR